MLILAAASLAAAVRAQSQTASVGGAEAVATRLQDPASSVGSDSFSVSGADAYARQSTSLAAAIASLPAANVFAAGRLGGPAWAFLRGADSDQTLFLVDGIRFSDAGTDYSRFLGGASLLPGDRLDAVLGPQSALYGGGAAGGVLSLALSKGTGRLSGTLGAEAGSFGTVAGYLSAQGATGAWAFDFGAAGSTTDNDRANNTYRGATAALRLDRSLGSNLGLGATVRVFESRYGDPGSLASDDPYAHEDEGDWLETVFAEARLTQYVASRLTLGAQQRELGQFEGAAQTKTTVRDHRQVMDWKNTFLLLEGNRLVAGIDCEAQGSYDDGFGRIDRGQSLFALYAQDEWTLFEGFTLEGGVRRDDYDTSGAASTGRLTAAYLTAERSLKLHGSCGSAFNPPSLLDLYGRDAGYVGNPALRPERSSGWDAGLDFTAPGSAGSLSATWFRNDFHNLVEYNYAVYPYTVVNWGRARTQGLELAYTTVLAGALRTRLTYDRLETGDESTGRSLPWRPHYAASGDFNAQIATGVTLGAGATWIGTRSDVDARTCLLTSDAGYAVACLYASWQALSRLQLQARVENALDRSYAPVNGYPAPGRGIYLGARFSW